MPLQNYLKDKGVQFQYDTLVTDLDIEFEHADKVTGTKKVKAIITEKASEQTTIPMGSNDYVIVTTGSMTEDTRYGDDHTAPTLDFTKDTMGQSSGWKVWNNLAKQSAVLVIQKNLISMWINLLGCRRR